MSAEGSDERRVGGLSMGPNPVTAPCLEVQSENVRGNADGAYATSCAPPEHATHGNHDPCNSAKRIGPTERLLGSPTSLWGGRE